MTMRQLAATLRRGAGAGQAPHAQARDGVAVRFGRVPRGELAMILPLTGLVIGAILGAWRARRHGGGAADMAQWGAAHGVALGVVGLFLLLLVSRLAG
ncbi:MAG: hypothetical protein ACU0B9_09895 [Limimaricola soesokkakensis]|uniref:hypothetical protein n=1 Tax=Limimaricola soesokkakensis TaxID=1343159 RepID=UPI0040580B2F